LESFILFSAGAAWLGSPGQANYAAANAFLVGLARRRHRAGLPALSVAWGGGADVGGAARAAGEWSAQGGAAIKPADGCAALELLLRSDDALAAVLPIDWTRFPTAAQDGTARPFFEFVAQPRSAADAGVGQRWLGPLSAAAPRDRVALLENLLGVEVARVLGMDPSRPPSRKKGLTDIGVDSLMAVELANRIGRQLDTKLPATFVFEHSTVEAMAAQLLDMLGLRTPRVQNEDEARAETGEAGNGEAVAAMSAEQASAALLDELDRIGY
jgi:acyl carrier protein